jgi:hypothetical protein
VGPLCNVEGVWGAPHALACAALLPDRVRRGDSVVGPAPFDAEGLDWFAGMSAGNVEEFTRARLGEAAYRPLVERLAREAVASVEAGQVQIPGDYDLPEADLEALRGRLLGLVIASAHAWRIWTAWAAGSTT